MIDKVVRLKLSQYSFISEELDNKSMIRIPFKFKDLTKVVRMGSNAVNSLLAKTAP